MDDGSGEHKGHDSDGSPSRAGKPLTMMMECRIHGEIDFVQRPDGSMRCKRCRSEAVSRRRRRVKAILIAEAGGACILCGYSRSVRALEFHHLDPNEKRFGLSSQGLARSLESMRIEARKCVLLCSNCHAEVEDGLVSVPINCT
jgi:hypothetical protein